MKKLKIFESVVPDDIKSALDGIRFPVKDSWIKYDLSGFDNRPKENTVNITLLPTDNPKQDGSLHIALVKSIGKAYRIKYWNYVMKGGDASQYAHTLYDCIKLIQNALNNIGYKLVDGDNERQLKYNNEATNNSLNWNFYD